MARVALGVFTGLMLFSMVAGAAALAILIQDAKDRQLCLMGKGYWYQFYIPPCKAAPQDWQNLSCAQRPAQHACHHG